MRKIWLLVMVIALATSSVGQAADTRISGTWRVYREVTYTNNAYEQYQQEVFGDMPRATPDVLWTINWDGSNIGIVEEERNDIFAITGTKTDVSVVDYRLAGSRLEMLLAREDSVGMGVLYTREKCVLEFDHGLGVADGTYERVTSQRRIAERDPNATYNKGTIELERIDETNQPAASPSPSDFSFELSTSNSTPEPRSSESSRTEVIAAIEVLDAQIAEQDRKIEQQRLSIELYESMDDGGATSAMLLQTSYELLATYEKLRMQYELEREELKAKL